MKTITSKPSYVIDESLNIGQHNWDQPDNLAIRQFAWFDLPRKLMIVDMGSYPVQDGDLIMKCLNTLWQKIATEVPIPRS